MRYCIKTLHWGRYHDMYGDEWVDIENQHFVDDLREAMTYADDQCKIPKTISSTVFCTENYEEVYIGITNRSNQLD